MSSFNGTTECRTCAKGKFNKEFGSALCHNCPPHTYQPFDVRREDAQECLSCPTGYDQESSGQAVCADLGGKKASDCRDNEYFNATLKIQDDDTPPGECVICPPGSYCVGDIDHKGVRPLFGWSQCNNSMVFERCRYRGSCLGAPNLVLRGQFVINGTDPAVQNHNTTCNNGFLNPPSLNPQCSTCAKGYATTGDGSGLCIKCVDAGDSMTLLVLVVVRFIHVAPFAPFPFFFLWHAFWLIYSRSHSFCFSYRSPFRRSCCPSPFSSF
jgi:hypothetical protein